MCVELYHCLVAFHAVGGNARQGVILHSLSLSQTPAPTQPVHLKKTKLHGWLTFFVSHFFDSRPLDPRNPSEPPVQKVITRISRPSQTSRGITERTRHLSLSVAEVSFKFHCLTCEDCLCLRHRGGLSEGVSGDLHGRSPVQETLVDEVGILAWRSRVGLSCRGSPAGKVRPSCGTGALPAVHFSGIEVVGLHNGWFSAFLSSSLTEGFPRTRKTKRSCACDCGRGPVSVGAFFLSSFLLLSYVFFLLSSLTQNRALKLRIFCGKKRCLGRGARGPG